MVGGRTFSLLAGVVAACALHAGVAAAQEEPQQEQEQQVGSDPEARLAEIREMVLYARYSEAEEAVGALLAREDLTAAQRNAALEVRAVISIARAQTDAAQDVLRQLYSRDPEHRLVDRDASPRVRAAFERARDSVTDRATVELVNETPDELPSRSAPVISVRLAEGANVVQELRLSYRIGDSGPFERSIMRFGEGRSAARSRVPPQDGAEGYSVQYYVEALAPSLAVVGQLASADEPLTLQVPEARAAPQLATAPVDTGRDEDGGGVLEQWWFWTIVGVVVAGGALGVGLGVGLTADQVGPGTLGEGTLGAGLRLGEGAP